MSPRRTVLRAAALALGAMALQACDSQTLRGTQGLPPAPENVAYPNLNVAPQDRNRPLRSAEEQRRLKAELLARGRR
jgi:hypothetical protein